MQSYDAGGIRPRLDRLTSLLVLLLVCKNAAWSTALGRFGAHSTATLAWYGLAALFGVLAWSSTSHGLAAGPIRRAAPTLAWLGMGACAVLAWIQVTVGPADLPVRGCDWIVLGGCFGLGVVCWGASKTEPGASSVRRHEQRNRQRSGE